MADEPFTIRVDADGTPLRRALRDMTADEAWMAFCWHQDEADRLRPDGELAKSIINDCHKRLRLTRSQFLEHKAAFERSLEAEDKAIRIAEQICARLERFWVTEPSLKLRAALERYWSVEGTA